MDVLDDLTSAYDKSKQIDVIHLDLKKAFDTVPHRRLLLKIQAYKFQGEILSWIEDFLKERRRLPPVFLNGSVLGPVLFIVYINDMPDKLRYICKFFADDSKVYQSIQEETDQTAIQDDLFQVYDWSDLWLL